MYRHFLQQVEDFVGASHAQAVLWWAPILLLFVALILGSRSWRRRIEALEDRPGRWPLLALGVVNTLRLAAGVLGVGGLAAMLLVQAGLYREKQGQVTQRNYNAVTTKWGRPQEQRELRVTHYVWNVVTRETFAGGGTRSTVRADALPADPDRTAETLEDAIFPVKRDKKGHVVAPMALARRVVKRERKEVPQDSVVAADIALDLRATPRYLGGAGYAGYACDGTFTYAVRSRAPRKTLAVFRFPLPDGGYGLFDRLSVRIDGAPPPGGVQYRDGALVWHRVMSPASRVRVEVSYATRGLEYFRYWPGNLRERYLVRLRLRGVSPARLNFPIGSMSPRNDLKQLSGEDYTLHWDLSKAVTNFSIGVIVPAPVQPGFEVARLLKEAPPGLALLAVLLVATRLLLGRDAPLIPLGLSLVAHYLGYALFAHVSPHVERFATAFACGMVPPALLGCLFWIGRDGRSFAGIQTGLLFALVTVGYPLAVAEKTHTGAILQTAYVALAGYAMMLAILSHRRNTAETAPPPPTPA